MSVSLLFVLMLWISVMPCPTQAQDGRRELYFPDYYFFAWKSLVNHSIKSRFVKDLDECEYRCYLNENCVSLNIRDHHNGTHECELNNSTHLEHDGHLKDSQLYYYRGAENKCGKNELKCKNNSTCQSGFTQKGYRCLCTTGFKGEHCENDIDECEKGSHNCHSNANCNNTEGGYNCSCKEGYTGDGQNCTDIDDCASHPCTNNGTCTDRVNGFNCSCTPGFNGTQCEIDIDDCESHPCKNGGTCVDQVNGFSCSCAPGFNGTQCKTDIDECATQNNLCDATNSECNNTHGSYYCQCNDGFVKNGASCEEDVCKNYQPLTEGTRKYDYTTANSKCEDTLSGWYRFQEPAGTQMVTKCPPEDRCDTDFPVWLSGDHPTVAEGTVRRKVCIHKFGDCCESSLFIQVKNCSSYYIYKLFYPGVCNTRYCSMD